MKKIDVEDHEPQRLPFFLILRAFYECSNYTFKFTFEKMDTFIFGNPPCFTVLRNFNYFITILLSLFKNIMSYRRRALKSINCF